MSYVHAFWKGCTPSTYSVCVCVFMGHSFAKWIGIKPVHSFIHSPPHPILKIYWHHISTVTYSVITYLIKRIVIHLCAYVSTGMTNCYWSIDHLIVEAIKLTCLIKLYPLIVNNQIKQLHYRCHFVKTKFIREHIRSFFLLINRLAIKGF